MEHIGIQVAVSGESLRCPALANIAWSEPLPHFPDLIAFGISEKSAGHLNGYKEHNTEKSPADVLMESSSPRTRKIVKAFLRKHS